MEPQLIQCCPGSEQPGWSTFFRAFVTKWYTLFQAFLGQVAWFFSSVGGLVFFKHWPTFFLTFAKRGAIGKILRQLCEWKGVTIIAAEACPDHIHLFVEIPPKISVSGFMGYLKGKSAAMMYEQFGDLKYKYRNKEFWCRGYYVDTVGKNESRIAEYIENQLKEDEMGEQLVIPSVSPFTGRK